jgi:hypothetical protein
MDSSMVMYKYELPFAAVTRTYAVKGREARRE